MWPGVKQFDEFWRLLVYCLDLQIEDGFMKNVMVLGGLVLVIAVGAAIGLSFKFGKKSPVYVSGTISIDPEIQNKTTGIETLYLIIYDEESPRPMPYGAVRETFSAERYGNEFKFFITPEKLQTMIEGQPPPKKIRLKARLDRDGRAGLDQPGDLVGSVSGLVLGAENVTLPIKTFVRQ